MRRYGLLATVGVLGLLYAVGHSQPATPEQRGKLPLDERKYGTLNLSTRLGSFRAINCEGRMEFTFTGTVLISRMDGDVQVTGDVRKEYEFGDRKVYYGTGRVVASGKWRAIQWFGKDMRATFYGAGLVRVNGEFDSNQDTGLFWYDDKDLALPWPAASSRDVIVPEPFVNQRIQPIIKSSGG